MSAETRRRLLLAQQDARRRRHAATDPEHLLGVLLEIESEAAAVHARGLDPIELRDCIEAQLADRPPSGGYRDATDAPPSPALVQALRRTRGRLLPFVRKASLLEALLLDRGVAALVCTLRRGADARYVLERARALAIVHGHALVSVAHALRVIVDLRSFVDTLTRAGGNATPLIASLDAALLAQRTAPNDRPSLDAALRRVMSTTGPGTMTIRELCIALAREDACEPFWTAAGIARSAFLEAVYIPS